MTSEEKYGSDETIAYLRKDIGELRDAFENLINSKEPLDKSTIRGVITGAGATIEAILEYILIKEGKASLLKDENGKPIMLKNMQNLLQGLIPYEQNIHVSNLIQWRNHVTHKNNISKVKAHELTAVNSALNSFEEWFFNDYLKYKLPEFSKSSYADSSSPKQKVINKEEDNDGFEQVRALQDWAKKEGMETRKQERGIRMLRLIAILCIPVILYFGYRYFAKASAKLNTPEQVYTFMTNYSNRINSANFDAKEFFAESVLQFITQQNVTPERINQIVQENIDYIDSKTIIDRESVHLVRKEGNIAYWEYNMLFMCYRKSLNKFQSCKVEIEIGLSDTNKIVSYKELKVRDLRFSNKKMN